LVELQFSGGTTSGLGREGIVYRFDYDSERNLVGVHLSGGGSYRFDYDERNRVRHRTNPDGSEVDYRHNAVGNLVEVRARDGPSASSMTRPATSWPRSGRTEDASRTSTTRSRG